MPDGDAVTTAYHEAGHAVVAFLTGRPLVGITIRPVPDDDAEEPVAGSPEAPPPGSTARILVGRRQRHPGAGADRRRLRRGVAYRLAGRAAEEVFAVSADRGLDVGDLQAALDFAAADGDLTGAVSVVEAMYPRTVRLLGRPRSRVLAARVATELLEHDSLDAARLRSVLESD